MDSVLALVKDMREPRQALMTTIRKPKIGSRIVKKMGNGPGGSAPVQPDRRTGSPTPRWGQLANSGRIFQVRLVSADADDCLAAARANLRPTRTHTPSYSHTCAHTHTSHTPMSLSHTHARAHTRAYTHTHTHTHNPATHRTRHPHT